MRWFSRRSQLERSLEQQYAVMFVASGMSARDAQRTAERLVADAKAESEAPDAPKLPPRVGDILIEREASDPSMLEPKRRDGVTDEDIRWWWGLHDLERRVLLKVDDIMRMNAFNRFRQSGLCAEDATARLGRTFPIFGDPDDTRHGSGDDRPLPYELKDRINTWAARQQGADPEELDREVAAASSMNALVRREIRRGRL